MLTFLQNELSLEEKAARPSPPNRAMTDHGNRKENLQPRGPSVHRSSRSQEQTNRQRGPPNGSSRPKQTEELDIFADSPPKARKSPERRPRRNSDSSLIERKPLTDDEKRRQERRRRERKEREAAGKDGKPRKPSRKLDIIDQLDATSIYGTGCEYQARVLLVS